jgi:gluconolactonase
MSLVLAGSIADANTGIPIVGGAGMGFVEGPTVMPDGTVVVVDQSQPNGVLWQVDPVRQTVAPWITVGTQGCNGSTLGPDGWLYIAHSGLDAILRATKDTSGVQAVETVAQSSPTLIFNGPNDLVFHSNGNLYFTDPTGSGDKTRGGVFLRRTSGEIAKIISKIVTPNGIGLSPDEQTLYVAQSDLTLWLRP